MTPFKAIAKVALVFMLLIGISTFTQAQSKKVRPSLPASVAQGIGVDGKIVIEYSRPGVKGRPIWGVLVPYGLAEGNKYSDNKPYPWRAGANENTTFETKTALTVEGKSLPAGKYGLHMIPGKDEWVIIFSKQNDIWGSYKYDEANDALRVTVKPSEAGHQEWLTYGVDNLDGSKASVYLHWEKVKVAFNVAVAEDSVSESD